MGFTYVNIVILYNCRQNPFYSIKEEYSIWNPYNNEFPKYNQNLQQEGWRKDVKYKTIY